MEHVGNTPLIRLDRVTANLPATVEIYAKAEWFNPSGSVKDRPAAAILQYAISEGYLGAGKALLDSTSGNMGIAYATLGALSDISIHLAIPSNASPDRIKILQALGAELTLTDPLEGTDGARMVAAEMAAHQPERFFYADQYSNPANWIAHYESTGPEIATQTNERVTHFIAGLGTSGTMMGTGLYFRDHLPGVHLTAVQPDLALHGLEGLKHMASSTHPDFYDSNLADQVIEVSTEDAYAMARKLAREEGLLVGISAAAAASATLQVASDLKEGTLVVIFPDSASKYLDLPFWRED